MKEEPVLKYGGVLRLTIVSGKLTHDVETFSKMDPFVEVKFNNVVKKTSVQQEAGKTPTWNETLEFEVLSVDDYIDFTVLDQEFRGNDLIGSTQIIVKNLITSDSNKLQWIEIVYARKSAGKISIKADWQAFPDGSKKAANLKLQEKDVKDYERWLEEKQRKLNETEVEISFLEEEIAQHLQLAEDLRNQAAVDIAQVKQDAEIRLARDKERNAALVNSMHAEFEAQIKELEVQIHSRISESGDLLKEFEQKLFVAHSRFPQELFGLAIFLLLLGGLAMEFLRL